MSVAALLSLLLSATPSDGAMQTVAIDATDPAAMACAIQRLQPFVSPYGIRQRWPVAAALPADQENTLGTLLSDTGPVADGYLQFLHIDRQARTVYVVEQGGFAGTRKVFGPLPLPRCTPATATATN